MPLPRAHFDRLVYFEYYLKERPRSITAYQELETGKEGRSSIEDCELGRPGHPVRQHGEQLTCRGASCPCALGKPRTILEIPSTFLIHDRRSIIADVLLACAAEKNSDSIAMAAGTLPRTHLWRSANLSRFHWDR